MPFKVCRIDSPSRQDSLPVAVIKDYPLEKRDYKPYAQCTLCVCQGSLLLRMWAFEALPPPGSVLRAVLSLFADKPGAALCVTLSPDGGAVLSLIKDGEETALPPSGDIRLRPYNGEDLQGIYWGGFVTIPQKWLDSLGKTIPLVPGEAFRGNFYKICKDPKWRHLGSFFPADFLGDPYLPNSMGEFLLVNY